MNWSMIGGVVMLIGTLAVGVGVFLHLKNGS